MIGGQKRPHSGFDFNGFLVFYEMDFIFIARITIHRDLVNKQGCGVG